MIVISTISVSVLVLLIVFMVSMFRLFMLGGWQTRALHVCGANHPDFYHTYNLVCPSCGKVDPKHNQWTRVVSRPTPFFGWELNK